MLDPQTHGTVLRHFGPWSVTTAGLVRDDEAGEPTFIPANRLFDLWSDGKNDKWGWPLLLVKKGVINKEGMDSFNEAFLYALDQLRAFRPTATAHVSAKETFAAQEALLK